MNKIWLIIQREFLTRVQKKSFLITTILVPLIFPLIIGGLVYVMKKESDAAKASVIHVVDQSGKFVFENTKKFTFVPLNLSLEAAKKSDSSKNFILLYIPPIDINKPKGLTIFTRENPSIEKVMGIKSAIEERIRDLKLVEFNIDKETLKNLKTDVSLNQVNIGPNGEEKATRSDIQNGVGFALGILIYMFVLIYGIQIMQGVIDEKTSKIVEVIVSSVKPFQLMLGKIVGIASVGLLQFLIWIVLITVLTSATVTYFGVKMPQQQAIEEVTKQMNNPEVNAAIESQKSELSEAMANFWELPFGKIAFVFVFYFLGGYLLYGALFAAVGSAVESIQESQQFQFPITLPLLIGYFGLFMFVLRDHSSTASFWLSVIPFTSPVAMVGRIAFGVPDWELALSMFLLVAGFILTTWIAGRIYRVGILMTGTKVSWKVLAKWFFMKS